MKKWFETLSQREQWMVSLGSAVVLLCLLYFMLIMPWEKKNDEIRHQWLLQREMLVWARPVVSQIHALRSQFNKTDKPTIPATEQLATIEEMLKSCGLGPHIQKLSQTSDQNVRVTFEVLAFDELAKCLTLMWRERSIGVERLDLASTPTQGMVKVDMTLQQGR